MSIVVHFSNILWFYEKEIEGFYQHVVFLIEDHMQIGSNVSEECTSRISTIFIKKNI